jgi:5-hydroxyisourate hydrolase-like protein (transthyretin family)
MKRVLLLFSALLFFVLCLPAGVAAQGEGVIDGEVTNGTASAPAESVAGLEVDLYQVTDGSGTFLQSTTTDEQGRFSFDGLATDSELTYAFQVAYQGIAYGAQSSFASGDTTIHVVATIYETTTSDGGISVDQQHVVIDFETDVLAIRELCILNNTTDEIYVGEEGTSVRFSLPTGAAQLSFGDEETASQFVEVPGGFAYLRPAMPGQTQVLYAYQVPYDGRELVLSRTIDYPTASLDVMVANVGVQVESPQLQYQSLTGGEGTAYLHFNGQYLPAGKEVELRFSGAAQGGPAPTMPGAGLGLSLQGYAPGVALLMVLLGASVPFAQLRWGRRRGTSPVEGTTGLEPPTDRVAGPQGQREELLHLLADLDDAHADGQIGEQAYEELRAKMKEHLRDVWTQ